MRHTRKNGLDVNSCKAAPDDDMDEVIMIEDTELNIEEKESDPNQGDSRTKETPEDDDDEIEIIKADIYKYQGDKTYSQEVRDDVFKFQYFDDFEEEVEILEDEDEEFEENVEEVEILEDED